ncbi:PIR Superfamily Protein [Plasmodium malariae]|uniref:PIR Superfamily Protein n=1 Tax=Plasmodium malariae TaxID=5858 RepID=A0A1A8WJ31_PLAMA|nr:PIR Superfamily Protein [Plasmodium malariae]
MLVRSSVIMCKFLGDVKEEEFKKMKIVHNYCKYYETIKQNLSMNGNLCYSVFENYLEEAVKIYDKMLHNCNFRNPEKYCAEFRNHVSDCFKFRNMDEVHSVLINGSETTENQSIFNFSQIVISVAISLAGMFFIWFILYKFTTLASWIRTNLVTKKLTSSNSDDTDRYELIEE